MILTSGSIKPYFMTYFCRLSLNTVCRQLTTLALHAAWLDQHRHAPLEPSRVIGLTYLCLEIYCAVFFQGSRNDVFSHGTAMFVNMPFSKMYDSVTIICICLKNTLHRSCWKNFQVRVETSTVFRVWRLLKHQFIWQARPAGISRLWVLRRIWSCWWPQAQSGKMRHRHFNKFTSISASHFKEY